MTRVAHLHWEVWIVWDQGRGTQLKVQCHFDFLPLPRAGVEGCAEGCAGCHAYRVAAMCDEDLCFA